MFLLLISVLHWFLSFPHVNTLLWIQLSEVDPQDNRDFHARGNGEKPPQYLNELVNSKMLISHGFLIPAQMKLEKPLLHRLSWHQLLLLRHIFCFLFCAAPALLWTDDAQGFVNTTSPSGGLCYSEAFTPELHRSPWHCSHSSWMPEPAALIHLLLIKDCCSTVRTNEGMLWNAPSLRKWHIVILFLKRTQHHLNKKVLISPKFPREVMTDVWKTQFLSTLGVQLMMHFFWSIYKVQRLSQHKRTTSG